MGKIHDRIKMGGAALARRKTQRDHMRSMERACTGPAPKPAEDHNMSTIRFFDAAGQRYRLLHHYDDDSRSVVASEDVDHKALIRFSSSLGITGTAGERLGMLSSRDGQWVLSLDGVTHQLGEVRDYHWRQLEIAEIEAAKLLLPRVLEGTACSQAA